MNSDFDMDADSCTLKKKEQWEQPDREAVIRDNPLPEYCQRHGLQLKRDGAAKRYKCLCPLHREKTPSFMIFADQGRFHCFGCGRNGNVIDLHAALKGVSGMEALCDLAGIEYHGAKRAGSTRQTEEKNNTAQSQSGNAESYDPFKDPEKAQKRQGWPVFEKPTSAEIETIATLRGLSPEGVTLAAERALLFTADSQEGCAWIITDSRRRTLKPEGSTAIHGSASAARRHGPCLVASAHCQSGFTKSVTFQISPWSKADRTFSPLSISRGARPLRRKPSHEEKASM